MALMFHPDSTNSTATTHRQPMLLANALIGNLSVVGYYAGMRKRNSRPFGPGVERHTRAHQRADCDRPQAAPQSLHSTTSSI